MCGPRSRPRLNYTGEFSTHRQLVYDFLLPWERLDFYPDLESHWTSVIWLAVIYAVFVHYGQKWMKNREAFSLRPLLFLWSLSLAIFSGFGFFRSFPEFVFTYVHYGFYGLCCNCNYVFNVNGFYSVLFVISKPLELIDTVFMVFRKQRVIFLHWYHHIIVMVVCFYTYKDLNSTGRWNYVMNYFVHTWMYSYYAARALRIPVPKWISVLITTMQILQMAFALAAYAYVPLFAWPSGRGCEITFESWLMCFLMYFSFFVLFVNFFYHSYLAPSRPSSKAGTVADFKKPTKKIDAYDNEAAAMSSKQPTEKFENVLDDGVILRRKLVEN